MVRRRVDTPAPRIMGGAQGAASAASGRVAGPNIEALTRSLDAFSQERLQLAEEAAAARNIAAGTAAAKTTIAEARAAGKPVAEQLTEQLTKEGGVFGGRNQALAAYNAGVRAVFKTAAYNDAVKELKTIEQAVLSEGVEDFDAEFQRRSGDYIAAVLEAQNEIDPSGQFTAELTPRLLDLQERYYSAIVTEKAERDLNTVRTEALNVLEERKQNAFQNFNMVTAGAPPAQIAQQIELEMADYEEALRSMAPAMQLTSSQIDDNLDQARVDMATEGVKQWWRTKLPSVADLGTPAGLQSLQELKDFLFNPETGGLRKDALPLELANLFDDDADAERLEAILQRDLADVDDALTSITDSVDLIRTQAEAIMSRDAIDGLRSDEFKRTLALAGFNTLEEARDWDVERLRSKGQKRKAALTYKRWTDIIDTGHVIAGINEMSASELAQFRSEWDPRFSAEAVGKLSGVTNTKSITAIEAAMDRRDKQLETAFASGDWADLGYQTGTSSVAATWNAAKQEVASLGFEATTTQDVMSTFWKMESANIDRGIRAADINDTGRNAQDFLASPKRAKSYKVLLDSPELQDPKLRLDFIQQYVKTAGRGHQNPLQTLELLGEDYQYMQAAMLFRGAGMEDAAVAALAAAKPPSDIEIKAAAARAGITMDDTVLRERLQAFSLSKDRLEVANALSAGTGDPESNLNALVGLSDSLARQMMVEGFQAGKDAGDVIKRYNNVWDKAKESLHEWPNGQKHVYDPVLLENDEVMMSVNKWLDADWIRKTVTPEELAAAGITHNLDDVLTRALPVVYTNPRGVMQIRLLENPRESKNNPSNHLFPKALNINLKRLEDSPVIQETREDIQRERERQAERESRVNSTNLHMNRLTGRGR